MNLTNERKYVIINTARETALVVPAKKVNKFIITVLCWKLKGGYFFICFISSINNAIRAIVSIESK